MRRAIRVVVLGALVMVAQHLDHAAIGDDAMGASGDKAFQF